jgi:ZIP family zinc transporter
MFEGISWQDMLAVLALTTFAGLATGVGGAIGFFVKKTNIRLLTFLLGLSAGVMVYISFVELLASAQETLAEIYGKFNGHLVGLASFSGGMLPAMLIDRLIPEKENPHEAHGPEELHVPVKLPKSDATSAAKMRRSGLLFALAIGVHNFPEGMATFAAGINSLTLGIPIAVAVALHNIPEGITVSVPIYHATGSRKKAFMYSMVSGLAEPIGSGIAMLVLYPCLSAPLLSVLFAAVAGTMVFIAFDELLPMAERWGFHHLSIYGIITGMLLMGFTLAVI